MEEKQQVRVFVSKDLYKEYIKLIKTKTNEKIMGFNQKIFEKGMEESIKELKKK